MPTTLPRIFPPPYHAAVNRTMVAARAIYSLVATFPVPVAKRENVSDRRSPRSGPCGGAMGAGTEREWEFRMRFDRTSWSSAIACDE